MQRKVDIIGGGLAGCDAAWQLAQRGIDVRLHEMKPHKKTPAHNSDQLAELVCSNSLRSDRISNAVGLLKEEMRRMGSLVIEAADATQVPAGGALAVDRELFSGYVTDKISGNGKIELIEGEVTDLGAFTPDGTVIVASGPLTSDALAQSIQAVTGEEYLHFFDAAAPIISAESVDMGQAFWASRYDRGSDYLNCPMDEQQYKVFYDALVGAQCAVLKEFDMDGAQVFEGCMPVETMAQRGYETLLFGPLKPKGLTDPQDGKRPFAVVQLRKEDAAGSMFNLVGFQTHLKFPEQKRVFSLIPALRNAEFLRYGVMHRNTYLQSPKLLDTRYRLKKRPNIRFCGQITGVEGYVESAASGLMCGVYTAAELMEEDIDVLDRYTALGALGEHVAASVSKDFQPMNINFGIIEPLGQRVRGKEQKNTMIAERALEKINTYAEKHGIN